jgi:UDP-glucose 4-epimerase
MNLLVTGGAGYIGAATTAELIAAGHTVSVLDNLSHGHRAAVPPQATFVHADIGDRAALAGSSPRPGSTRCCTSPP